MSVCFVDMFSQCGSSFHSINSGCCTANIFNIDEVPVYQFIFFYELCFGVIPKNSLPNPRSQKFSSMVSFKCFIVLYFSFISLIYFELIWVKSVSVESELRGPEGSRQLMTDL